MGVLSKADLERASGDRNVVPFNILKDYLYYSSNVSNYLMNNKSSINNIEKKSKVE
jgi:hypothetical protein